MGEQLCKESFTKDKAFCLQQSVCVCRCLLQGSRSDISALDTGCSCCSVFWSLQALAARQRVQHQRLRLDKARRRMQQLEQDAYRAQQHITAKLTVAQLTQKILALQAGSLVTALEAALVGCSDAVGTYEKGASSGRELN